MPLSRSSAIQPLVVLSEPISPVAVERLRAGAEVRIASSPDQDVLASEAQDADALIVRSTRIGTTVIEACPRLRVIGRHGAGTENIDLDAASGRGVRVVNTPGANAYSVAEFVILAMLALSRRLPAATKALRSGELASGSSLPGAVVGAGLTGQTLRGRTLGVVGLGAIGRLVADLGSRLGMHVLGHDPYVDHAPPGIELVGLEDLAGRSSLVSLHLPATAATRNLVDAGLLALLPAGALVVNSARAEVVDSEAMLAALDAGRIGGYAVDVFAPEPPAADEAWLHHPRVLATPHMAAMTEDALMQMATDVVDGVLAVLRGVPGAHVVNAAQIEAGGMS